MITEEKKEEVKLAADIVEVVSDYVKLKKAGNGFVGLCPYHNEKTPSFHVTPRLGIFKCFGCSESGDVLKFVMDQEGIGFNEAVRQLADRYGVIIPEAEISEEQARVQNEHEGILHALKFAGVFYYKNLIENEEASPGLDYLEKRGYPLKLIKHFGIGFAPSSGDDLYKAAMSAGISEHYLVEAGLIKKSQRDDGFYDVFRGRLMFPIFNPSGKVIAFAGRVLGNEKTAKYINSSQTQVYNKSEVVYGLNYSRNEIRKQAEVILVEGYTDVITLYQHEVLNVVASSGTALTQGQIKLLKRYGEKIVMIYDSDAAGQQAMKRGIDIALEEGMDVELLDLPEGEDPDSFVKQFGKDSFLSFKKDNASDFVTFLIRKAEEEGRLENPSERAKVITEILETIALIPDPIKRQVYVQHLHQKTQKYRSGSDRELFQQLDKILGEINAQKQKIERRDAIRAQRKSEEAPPFIPNEPLPQKIAPPKKKPHYEKELIRLMISYNNKMVEYVGALCNERLFEDGELRLFFEKIIEDFREGAEITINRYSSLSEPYPSIVADVLMEQYSPSERHHEKTGMKYEKDKNPFATARSTIKSLQLSYSKRIREELAEALKIAEGNEKTDLIRKQAHIQREINKIESTHFDDLYPSEPGRKEKAREKIFEYKMKKSKDS